MDLGKLLENHEYQHGDIINSNADEGCPEAICKMRINISFSPE